VDWDGGRRAEGKQRTGGRRGRGGAGGAAGLEAARLEAVRGGGHPGCGTGASTRGRPAWRWPAGGLERRCRDGGRAGAAAGRRTGTRGVAAQPSRGWEATSGREGSDGWESGGWTE
jgi:hypothetical protein